MNEGYIKFYRKFTKWEWYQDINTKTVFIHLLLTANFERKTWRGIVVDKGQLLTGRKKLADELNLSEQQIRTSLLNLQSTNNITIKSTNKFSLITVENWGKYQGVLNEINQQNNQQNTSKSTSKLTTTKEIKNNKEIKKDILSSKLDDKSQIFSRVIDYFNRVGILENYFKKNKVEFHFKKNEANQKLVQNILDKGYTESNILDVIFLKYEQWIENNKKNKTDMSTYYRPSTVLGEKFEEYLQEAKMKGVS